MNTKIQSVGFSADKKLLDFIEVKSKKLLTFHDKIIDNDIHLKLDSHTKVKDKVVYFRCNIPNASLFAEATAKSFEEAVDEAIDEIRRQLNKKKDQQNAKGDLPIDALDFGVAESDDDDL